MTIQDRDEYRRRKAAKELQQARMLLRTAVAKLNECETNYLGEDDPETVAALAYEAYNRTQYAAMALSRMMNHTLRRLPPEG